MEENDSTCSLKPSIIRLKRGEHTYNLGVQAACTDTVLTALLNAIFIKQSDSRCQGRGPSILTVFQLHQKQDEEKFNLTNILFFDKTFGR